MHRRHTRVFRHNPLNLKTELLSDINHELGLQTDIYSRKLKSSTELRGFKNNYYDAFISYSSFFSISSLKNLMKVRTGYYRDNIFPDKISVGKIVTDSKMKQKGDRTLSFDVKLGGEYYDRNKKKQDCHYIAGLGINKFISRSLSFGLNVEKENMNKISRDIIDGFKFDDDILPLSGVKYLYGMNPFTVVTGVRPDDNFKAEFLTSFIIGGMLLQAKVRHLYSRNKIIYEEVDFLLQDEVPIQVINYYKDVSWQEVAIKNSYAFSIFRGELSYVYNNLKNIPFNPEHKFFVGLIFQYWKFENRISGKYYSPMYGKVEQRNKIKEFKTIDLLNSFKFNPNLIISFNVLNLINSDSEKKTKYPIDQRKIGLEFKITY